MPNPGSVGSPVTRVLNGSSGSGAPVVLVVREEEKEERRGDRRSISANVASEAAFRFLGGRIWRRSKFGTKKPINQWKMKSRNLSVVS